MKNILLPFLILISHASFSQAPFRYVVKKYFRSHPLKMRFSSFILSLHKDPWFKIDEENRRTDSTFFYLSGTYKNYNPLQFTPSELRLVLSEMQITYEDSLKTLDTVITMQLLGITDSSEAGKKMVKKEFKYFHNNHADRFSKSTYYSSKSRDGDVVAEIYNYFVYPFSIAPITIAWGVQPESHQYVFTITFRFKVTENISTFIVSPDEISNIYITD